MMSVIGNITNGDTKFTLRFSGDSAADEKWEIFRAEDLLLKFDYEDKALAFFEDLSTASLLGEIVDIHCVSFDEREKIAYVLVKGKDHKFVTFEIRDTFSLLFRGNEEGARDRFNRCVTPALDVYLRFAASIVNKVVAVRGRTHNFCTVLGRINNVGGHRWFVLDVTSSTWEVVGTPEDGFSTQAAGRQKFQELTMFK